MRFMQKEEGKLINLPISAIRANKAQPRIIFSEKELAGLAQSISVNGILQPLSVRKTAQNEYELIAGERRLRASVMAGLREVPCIVVKCSERQSAIFALIENLQRKDLNMFEEAYAIRKLILNCNLTQEKVAIQLGKTQSTIANKLRLLKIGEEEQKLILQNGLTERHARVLLKLPPQKRIEAIQKIVSGNLNVSASEALAAKMLEQSNEGKKAERKIIIKDVRIFMNTINRALDIMRLSGINAVTEQQEEDNFIKYTVRIPKEKAYRATKKESA